MIDKIEDFCLNILRKIKLGKVAEFYQKHIEGMRYLVFGVFSTIVNIFVFGMAKIFFSTIVSNVIAWIIAVIFAYVTNKIYVFKSQKVKINELFKEVTSFVGARIFTLIIETVFLNIFIDKLGYNSILMKIISNIIVVILNFIFSKLVIFRKSVKEE